MSALQIERETESHEREGEKKRKRQEKRKKENGGKRTNEVLYSSMVED